MADDQKSIPFRFEIVKNYPQRGPLFQYRLSGATSFMCCRCLRDKKSKLVSLIQDEWTRPLCNGCYGLLLSIWDVKAGDLAEVDRHAELVHILGRLAAADQVNRARLAIAAREARSKQLSADALTMLATADAVASAFAEKSLTELDWSAAVIGLCKSVEIESMRLIAEPLREHSARVDMTPDLSDKDFGKMAKYCRLGGRIELGALVHFLAISSTYSKSVASPLVAALREVSRQWPLADWLFSASGFIGNVQTLTRHFRNPAAHTAILTVDDYKECRRMVQGDDGILWNLLASIEPKRK